VYPHYNNNMLIKILTEKTNTCTYRYMYVYSYVLGIKRETDRQTKAHVAAPESSLCLRSTAEQ
jgi:hypothetical protein